MVTKKPGKAFVYGFAGLIISAFVVMALVGLVAVLLILVSPFAFADSIDENALANAQCLRCHNQLDGIPHKNVVYGRTLAEQVNNRCQACHDDGQSR